METGRITAGVNHEHDYQGRERTGEDRENDDCVNSTYKRGLDGWVYETPRARYLVGCSTQELRRVLVQGRDLAAKVRSTYTQGVLNENRR